MGKLNRPKKIYGVIYKIENKTNGMIYIGQTKQKMDTRIRNHWGRNPHHIGCALRKYGLENFDILIIDSAEDRKSLCELEIFWIIIYNSKTPNGYNLTDGGDGGDCCSGKPKTAEHKQKLSVANTGQIRPLQTGINISKAKKAKGKRKPLSPPRLCACNECGLMTKPGNSYIHGHQNKGKGKIKISLPCACGCLKLASPGKKYIQGHNALGHIPSEASNQKNSESHKTRPACIAQRKQLNESNKSKKSIIL